MTSTAPSAAPAFSRDGPGLRYRVESIPVRRLGNFALGVTLVSAAGALRWVNLANAPAGTSDEGLLVQRAWMLDESGSFDRLTDWYDHPPLGWLFLSLWSSATSAFERAPTAIAAGRSLSLVAAVATTGLLWVLARRVGLHRWASALALVLLGVSPLAVELQRPVSFDGLAAPWLVAAFALAAHPRRPLVAFAGSAACLAVAVLTNETSLVFAPVLVWQLRRSGLPSTRRYGFVVGGALFLAACTGYVVHAAVHGSLTAGTDHAGLLDGLHAQVLDRPPTGGVLTSGTFARDSVASWFAVDPVGLTLMLLAAMVVLVTAPRLRPYAACTLLPLGLALVPGFASPTLIIAALPFGALVAAGTAQQVWDAGQRRLVAVTAVAALGVGGLALWTGPHNRLLTADSDAPTRAAEAWVIENLPDAQRVLVDDAAWTDLAARIGPAHLTGYSALERDPAVGAAPTAGGSWRTYDVVVSSAALRRWPERFPGAAAAERESIVVATFGTGAERIELRRIVVGATAATMALNAHDPVAAADAGGALSRNPQLALTAEARASLVAGSVDLRLMTTLVAVAGLGPVEVDRFPADRAEGTSDQAPLRSVELRAPSGEARDAIAELLRAQAPPYRPIRIEPGPAGRLTVTYTPAALL